MNSEVQVFDINGELVAVKSFYNGELIKTYDCKEKKDIS